MNAQHQSRISTFLGAFAAFALSAGCATGEQAAMSSQASRSADGVETRGVPRVTQAREGLKPQAVAPAAQPAPPQALQLPTWPQRFEVQGPARASFGFAVTQPGPVVVDVQAQGALVFVSLQGPAPQPISQQGSGQIRLTYAVTPQDAQRSPFWIVQIRLVQPMPPQQGGRAGGIVMVQHPQVNMAQVQAAVAARQQAAQQQAAQRHAQVQQADAQAAAQMEAAWQQRKAQFEQQQMQRRAALMAPLQPILNQMRAQLGGGVRPRGLEETQSGETSSAGDVTSRGMISGTQLLVPTLPMAPTPVIASLNVTQGQPGDPVMITGSGFGNAGGEVHFIIAPGQDFPASGVTWGDTQIFATVPDVSGVLAFNGMIYIRRATDKAGSNLVPFRFNPSLELRQIRVPADYILQQISGVDAWVHDSGGWAGRVTHRNPYWFWGPQGNDRIFVNTRLKNGWTVHQIPSVFLPFSSAAEGGAHLVDSRVGTDWPYVNVGWWVDAAGLFAVVSTWLQYAISIPIQGPQGVPDGIKCTQIPCAPE